MPVKKIAYIGLLIALAFVFSYVETLIPISIGIPGAKLGLANLAIMITLYTLGEGYAFGLSMLRIVLVGFTFGNIAAMLYSFAGAILSYGVMVAAKKTKLFSITGVSVLGGIFHNVGQLVVAIFVVETVGLIYYLPVLLVTGVIAGVIIGIVGGEITRRIGATIGKLK